MPFEKYERCLYTDVDGVLFDIEAWRFVAAAYLARWFGTSAELAQAELQEFGQISRANHWSFTVRRLVTHFTKKFGRNLPGWDFQKLISVFEKKTLIEQLVVDEAVRQLVVLQAAGWAWAVASSGQPMWQGHKASLANDRKLGLAHSWELSVLELDKVPQLAAKLRSGDVVVDDNWEVLLRLADRLKRRIPKRGSSKTWDSHVQLFWLDWQYGQQASRESANEDVRKRLDEAGIIRITRFSELVSWLE